MRKPFKAPHTLARLAALIETGITDDKEIMRSMHLSLGYFENLKSELRALGIHLPTKGEKMRQKVINLRKDGLTYQEIAAQCGISKQRAHQIVNPKKA